MIKLVPEMKRNGHAGKRAPKRNGTIHAAGRLYIPNRASVADMRRDAGITTETVKRVSDLFAKLGI